MLPSCARALAALLLITLGACASTFKDPAVRAAEDDDWESAWAYVLPRAEAGFADDQVRVATMYAKGSGGRPVDMAEAVKFALLAAENQGMLAERIAPAVLGLATEAERAEGAARAAAFEERPLPRAWCDQFRPGMC